MTEDTTTEAVIAELLAADDYNRKHYERDPIHARAAATLRTLARERDELREALRECADDLAGELDARYPPELRAYASNEAKYQRDMAPVYRARELLGTERKKPRAATAGQGEG
jgi:hypothetical protein